MRHHLEESLEDPSRVDGDGIFIGVDERRDPAAVSPGYVTQAINQRFRNGYAEPRGGSQLIPCGPTDGLTSFTDPTEAIVYNDPNGIQWMIVVADGALYATRPNMVAQSLPVNSNDLSTVAGMTQAFDKLLLWRGDGPDAPAPLIFQNFNVGVRDITLQLPSSNIPGELPIPNSNTGTYFQNRLLVPFKPAGGKKDRVAVGDIGNYTRYTYPVNSFRLNEGQSDEIVEIVPHGQQSVVVFKQSSILYVDGLTPDSNGQYSGAYLNELTSRHGLAARRGWTKVGRDIYYLTSDGTFTSLGLTEEGRVSAKGVEPLSAQLPKTFARINPAYIEQAQATTWNDYIYLALPLDDAELLGDNLVPSGAAYNISVANYNTDTAAPVLLGTYTLNGLTVGKKYRWTQNGRETNYRLSLTGPDLHGSGIFTATGTTVTIDGAAAQGVTCTVQEVIAEGVCNAVAVYDTVNQAWAGTDESPGITTVKRWLKLDWDGRERLFYLTPDGYIRLYEEPTAQDETWQTIDPYMDAIILRVPSSSVTFEVNSGTTITVDNGTANTGTTWGRFCPLPSTTSDYHSRRNLWNDTTSSYGFDPSLANNWSAPNTTPSEIAYGVRFTATNDTLPVMGGSVQEAEVYIDNHDTSEIRSVPIATTLITRGYSYNTIANKRTLDLILRLAWWNPTWSVSILTPGVAEETAWETDKTYTRGASFTDGVAAAAVTNADGTLHRADQQDYSILLDATTGTQLGDGLQLYRHQYRKWARRLDAKEAPWFRIKITNTTGSLRILATGLTTRPGPGSPEHN